MKYLNDLPIKLDDHGQGRGNEGWVWSATFAPDGQSLMTGAGDGIIRYWPTHPDELAETICGNELIQHNLSEDTWNAYVGEDIPYKETCKGKPKMEDNL
jgi:WD40 repeat protein